MKRNLFVIAFLVVVSIILLMILVPGPIEVDDILPAEHWAEEYPDQYESYQRNLEMERTTFGGSEPYQYPEEYPFLETLYAGNAFSQDYRRSRGHPYALEDVINTERPKPAASCLSCKSSDYVGMLNEHGSEAAAMDFDEMSEIAVNPVSCFDCHRNEPGNPVVTRTHLNEALEHIEEGIDLGNLVCGQCHIEYYLHDDTKVVSVPWDRGYNAWAVEEETLARGHVDWVHPLTGAELLKVQHPEFETYMGSIHDRAGVTCIDCHMPEMVNEEGDTYSSHHWTSPLKHVEASCLGCHQETEEELIVRTEEVQGEVYEKTNRAAEMLVEFIEEFEDALDSGELSDEVIEQAREYHQRAMWRWDFVFVENGTGFHNSAFAMEILEEAMEYSQQGLELIQN